jgi:hypothetical protein
MIAITIGTTTKMDGTIAVIAMSIATDMYRPSDLSLAGKMRADRQKKEQRDGKRYANSAGRDGSA